MLALLIAGLLHAETAAVQVSASRQAISNMQAMRRMKLSVYAVTACSDSDVLVPSGKLLSALAVRGVPSEDPAFLPFTLARGQSVSTLGRLRTAGEVGSGLAAIVATVAKADPWIAGGSAGLAVVLRLVQRRQDDIVALLTPLAGRLMRPDVQVPLPEGICYSGLVLSAGDVPYAESSVLVRVPDAPITMNYSGFSNSWARRVDVEFVPR